MVADASMVVGCLSGPCRTLDEVRPLLVAAFGEGDVGGTGLLLDGHQAEARKGKQEVEGNDVNFLYGELLPETVSSVLERLGANLGGSILELGMGTGKVAFQAFLQCPNAQQVVGVELSSARYEIAVAAAERLALAHGDRFSACAADGDVIAELLGQAAHCAGHAGGVVRGHVLREVASGRRLCLLEGDLAALGGPIAGAKAIFMNLRLPPAARLRAYAALQRAPDGCRVFSLENLTWEWTLPEAAVLHAVGEGVVRGETELFATSWCEEGYPFYIFRVDRSIPPSITADYAIDAVKELYSQAFF